MPVAEIVAIVGVINTCCDAVKRCADAGNDLQSIGNFIGQLGEAQINLQAYQNKRGNNLSADEVIQLALAKKAYTDRMQEVKDLFVWSGNGHIWDEIQMELANARKRRQAEMRAKEAARKKALEISMWAGFMLVVSVAVFMGMLYAISSYAGDFEKDIPDMIMPLGNMAILW